jgi:hypothetical protein
MMLFRAKKWTRLVLPAYLAIALTGAFAFAAADQLRPGDFGRGPRPGVSFLQADLALDCLAESEAVIGKAGGHSLSPLRNGSLRIVLPLGPQAVGAFCSQASLKIIEKAHYRDIKNTILLKLRI